MFVVKILTFLFVLIVTLNNAEQAEGYTIDSRCFQTLKTFFSFCGDAKESEEEENNEVTGNGGKRPFCRTRRDGDFCGEEFLPREYYFAVHPNEIRDNKYQECAFDKVDIGSGKKTCYEEVMQKYFNSQMRDCDGNGRINCLDVALIHLFGPSNCHVPSLRLSYTWQMFLTVAEVQHLEDHEKVDAKKLGEAPRISRSDVDEEGNMLLTCPKLAGYTGEHTIVWRKDGDIQSGNGNQLELMAIDKYNSGIYSCEIRNKDGMEVATFEVNIIIPVTFMMPSSRDACQTQSLKEPES